MVCSVVGDTVVAPIKEMTNIINHVSSVVHDPSNSVVLLSLKSFALFALLYAIGVVCGELFIVHNLLGFA